MKLKSISLISAFFFAASSIFSQTVIYDDFSSKSLPGWVWGSVEMTYSHEEDNRENGFAEIRTSNKIVPGQFIGKVTKVTPMLFTAGNFLNLMLQGVDNDVYIKISLVYDIDMNNRYDEETDVMLVSNAIPLNFNGWKELKIKLDQENFSLVTNINEDFSITETKAFALNIDYIAGDNYKSSQFETGIALISEIQNREVFEDTGFFSNLSADELYFNAKNYPNPFNPSTTITFVLPEASYVNLTVYDRLGREIRSILDGNRSAGTYTVEFNAENLPSGIYFYRIKTSFHTEVYKMMLAK